MLKPDTSTLVLIDVQGRLAAVMHDRERLYSNLQILVHGMQALDVPVLWMEQNPSRMGRTIKPLRELLADLAPIPKMTFSCCGEPAFMQALTAAKRRQIILAGIESHVCVCQTAMDLLARDYHVDVVSDAVSSRTPDNKAIGLARAGAAGAGITSTESVLFELMGTAAHAAFRDVLKLVK